MRQIGLYCLKSYRRLVSTTWHRLTVLFIFTLTLGISPMAGSGVLPADVEEIGIAATPGTDLRSVPGATVCPFSFAGETMVMEQAASPGSGDWLA